MARKSKGRQRVEMVKMENESNLQVTFSKRRAGLFKKASELCTLCAVDVAIVVFSPGKKVFSFGHPSVEAVVERFLGGENSQPVGESSAGAAGTEELIEAHRNARVRELNMELTHLEAIIEAEKKRGEAIDGFVQANREAQGWIRASKDELSLQQLVTLKNEMENLMKEVHQKAHQLMMMHGNGYLFNPFAGGVLPSGNRAAGASTSALNFGGGGGGAAAAGAPPFTSGPTGALPFTSGGAAAASGFHANGSMAGGYNNGIGRGFF